MAEWQQTMYSLDSGINSGATTVRDVDGELTSIRYYRAETLEEPSKSSSRRDQPRSLTLLSPLPSVHRL